MVTYINNLNSEIHYICVTVIKFCNNKISVYNHLKKNIFAQYSRAIRTNHIFIHLLAMDWTYEKTGSGLKKMGQSGVHFLKVSFVAPRSDARGGSQTIESGTYHHSLCDRYISPRSQDYIFYFALIK